MKPKSGQNEIKMDMKQLHHIEVVSRKKESSLSLHYQAQTGGTINVNTAPLGLSCLCKIGEQINHNQQCLAKKKDVWENLCKSGTQTNLFK